MDPIEIVIDVRLENITRIQRNISNEPNIVIWEDVLCANVKSGDIPVLQDAWICHSCTSGGDNEEMIICTECVRRCHSQHSVSQYSKLTMVCSCNINSSCRIAK